jgi:uncharacterized protein YidB (DUF937 family)
VTSAGGDSGRPSRLTNTDLNYPCLGRPKGGPLARSTSDGGADINIFDTIGSLLGKSDNSPMSVPEALVAALGNQDGGLGSLVQKFESAGLGSVISSWIGKGEIRR